MQDQPGVLPDAQHAGESDTDCRTMKHVTENHQFKENQSGKKEN